MAPEDPTTPAAPDTPTPDAPTPDSDLPVHSGKAAGVRVDNSTPLLDQSEFTEAMHERSRDPVDLTIDTEPERLSNIETLPYDPIIHERTRSPRDQVDPATWDDLRALPAPPPTASDKDVTVYVCIQHPWMQVYVPGVGFARFRDGYLVTDDSRVKKALEHSSQRYVKRLDNSKLRS